MNAASDFTKSLKTPSAVRSHLQFNSNRQQSATKYEIVELLTVFGTDLNASDFKEGVTYQPQVLYYFDKDSF